MMVPGLNDLVYVMGVGQCAWSYSFHWSRFLGFKAIYCRFIPDLVLVT